MECIEFDGDVHTFYSSQGTPFLTKFGQKYQNYLFKLIFDTESRDVHVYDFRMEIPFSDKFVLKFIKLSASGKVWYLAYLAFTLSDYPANTSFVQIWSKSSKLFVSGEIWNLRWLEYPKLNGGFHFFYFRHLTHFFGKLTPKNLILPV